MKTVKSWSELESMFNDAGSTELLEQMGVSKDAVKDVLMHDVADEMEKILLKHIKSDIYGAYSPHKFKWGWNYVPPGFVRLGTEYTTSRYIQYKRRGSLNNKGTMVRKMLDDNTVFVTQDAPPNESVIGSGWESNEGGFLQMLGTHVGRIWHGAFERDAITPAQAEIDSSPEIQAAFERGIKKYVK